MSTELIETPAIAPQCPESEEISELARPAQSRQIEPAMVPWLWKPGQSGNPGGRPKRKHYTEALTAYVESDKGKRQLARSVASAVAVAAKNPSMAVVVRETLEGKLVEHVEHSGSLELAARVARARAAIAGDEELQASQSSQLDEK